MKNCPYCIELKDKLTSEGITFEDVDIDLKENDDEYGMVLRAADSDEVPIIRINTKLIVPNKSFNTIDEAVTIVKKLVL